MTEWIAESDWKKIFAGQLVKAELGTPDQSGYTQVIGAVRVDEEGDRYLPGAGFLSNIYTSYAPLDREGWSLFVEAKPEPQLPTEPGVYIDKFDGLWRVHVDFTYERVGGRKAFPRAFYAPFTRLAPEADVARRVLNRVRDYSITRTSDTYTIRALVLENIGDEFGVSE